ncbi:hypothetical protein CANMA_001675 [Candida margitis]|uniref:uncharacterized protein n=1 Tax=Candida margitis TaxID=1775924 RepID=UPI0022274315|nr:uncharacterized protein CANMA_001675 [Candida margitis]KAI5969228.1 hypothetical protein CANMA_001675 [Candida margitis]
MNYILYLVLFTAFIIYKVIDHVHYTRRAKKYGCKPAKQVPYRIPFGGFGLEFLLYLKNKHDHGLAHEGLDDIFRKLNTTTIATTVGIEYNVFTAEPENIRHMVSSAHTSEFGLGVRLEVFSLLLGDGVFSSEGTSWKHSRMMLRPFFARENIKQIQSMEPFVQSIIKAIKKAPNMKIDMQDIFQHFTLDYSTFFLLGESCDCLKSYLGEPTNGSITSESKAKFAESFDKGADYLLWKLMAGKFHPFYQPRQLYIYIKYQHDLVDYYVQKALNMSEQDLKNSSNDGTTFIYDLAQQTKDPKVLRDEILSIIVAGRSTTSALMTFLFLELGRHSDVFVRLRDIVRTQFPDVESITFESIQQCEYLRWCINETLRFRPPVPYNSRTAIHDTVLPRGGGDDNESPMFVRKGTKIIHPLWSVHRLEKYFGKDTHSFNPDRWSSLPVSGGLAFMPFGTGPRNCLGQQLALLETSYVAIRLLQTFDSIKSDLANVRTKSTVTMVSMDGCKVTFG